MRRVPLILLAAPVAVTMMVGGCVSSGSIAPPVTTAMINAASGASPENLEEGRRIFTGPCTACHAADPVSRYTVGEWREIVGDMAPRTKLDATRRAALLSYISGAKSVNMPP